MDAAPSFGVRMISKVPSYDFREIIFKLDKTATQQRNNSTHKNTVIANLRKYSKQHT